MAKRKKITKPSKQVLQFRVREDIYSDLQKSAKDHRFSISEEAEHRIRLSFEWESTRIEMQRLTTTIEGLRELMTAQGLKRVHLDQGAFWAEPGVDTSRLSLSLNAATIVDAMKPALTAALISALEKTKGEP